MRNRCNQLIQLLYGLRCASNIERPYLCVGIVDHIRSSSSTDDIQPCFAHSISKGLQLFNATAESSIKSICWDAQSRKQHFPNIAVYELFNVAKSTRIDGIIPRHSINRENPSVWHICLHLLNEHVVQLICCIANIKVAIKDGHAQTRIIKSSCLHS